MHGIGVSNNASFAVETNSCIELSFCFFPSKKSKMKSMFYFCVACVIFKVFLSFSSSFCRRLYWFNFKSG